MVELHFLVVQGGVGHVVVDADGEVVLGLGLLQVVIDSDELAGSGVLGGEAVAAAHDLDVAAAGLVQGGDHIQVHGLAHGAGLLGAVQHGDFLHRGGNSGGEVLHGEGTVQVNLHHAHLAALGVQIVHGLLHSLGGGAHHHDDLLRVGSAVVVEQLIVPTGELVDLIHVVLDGIGDRGSLFVGALLALEVQIGVDVVAAVGGMLGVQGVAAEILESLLVHQPPQVLVVQSLDTLHLVGSAETIKAVHEGVLAADSGQVGHSGQVHGLLGAGGHQHGVAGGAAGHEVGVVAEDGVVVGGDHPGGDVHDAGEELAAHGVHGGDHQHQALGGREGGGQGAGLQGAVAGTGGTGLGLHLDDIHGGAEQVLLSLGGPLVHLLRHGGGGRDGVNCSNFRKGISRICRGGVAVHNYIFLFHMKRPLSYKMVLKKCRLIKRNCTRGRWPFR